MEFLTTPDLPARRLTRPLASSPPTTTSPHAPNAAATPATASSPAVPSLQTPSATPYPSTPYHAAAAPLDRAGIKNSFQSLFSPSPNAAAITPALLRPPSSAPGLTPFLAGLPTPALLMQNLMPPFVSLDQAQHQQQELLSSPFLQAAAKEAVRREFLNMPTYVSATPHAPPAPSTPSTSLPSYAGERAVPAPHASTSSTPQNQTTPQALASQSPASSNLSPGDAKVPNNVHLEQPSSSDNLPSTSQNLQSTAQSQPYFIPHPHPHQHPHVQPRVMMMGQHGPVMVPAPPHMYAPPHMMMFPSAQPFAPPHQQPGAPHQQPQPCLPQHHVFMPPHMAAHVPTVKLESQVDKKKSDETEKQDLIREFKKKTREAALVRFRQKRRDRRFGKLIRYDCRKKLADARPRVKGRFVRIKEDEEEGPQVVPDMEDR